MKRCRMGFALALVLSLAPGCRTASLAQRATSSTPRAISSQEPKSENLAVQSPAEFAVRDRVIRLASAETLEAGTTALSAAVESPQFNQLSVRAAVETGLAQNPDLIALRQAEGVGTATLGTAQTYPFNPWVQVQATPYQQAPNGASGTTAHYILLMQQIQLAHQQQHREEAACAALNSIRWNVLQAELVNVAQTERLYFAAVYQRGLRDLADVNARNNRQLLQIVSSQLEAGQATAADVAIVKLDARSALQQQRLAEANLQTALLDLKRHLGLPLESQFDLDDNVIRWTWRPADSLQLADLAAGRPDVMAARADADTARANTNLANAARTPDLQLGPIYLRDDFGVTFLGFRGQMDLPVINSGVPLLRQREAEQCQRMMTSQQLATRARLEGDAAARRYERARQLMVESGGSSHDELPIELQRLEEQFKAGEVDVLRVLQARNSLLQNQRADLDTLNELMLAAVAVTATTGSPLESLIVPSVVEPRRPSEQAREVDVTNEDHDLKLTLPLQPK